MSSSRASSTELLEDPPAMVALLRGLLRRCPRCGRGKLFKRWFNFPKTCPR